jgi:uncharacterized protein YndB with AHSA1/START domain
MPAKPAVPESEIENANEIVGSRIFDAPRDLVFALWSDPKHIVEWWGPEGFRTTIHKMDFRAGGEWNFTMHGPDGRDYANKIIYREIVPNERISYSHISGPNFEATATFEDAGRGKTKLTMRMAFATAELRNKVAIDFGAVEGLHETLGRLVDRVNEALADEFVFSRTYDAPRDVVFDAWTQAGQLAQWWGPKGFEMMKTSIDLKPGGLFHYGMKMPGGGEMWGRFVFREIVPPRRLVFVNSFSDADAALAAPPFPMPWPPEMLNRVTFEESGGRTTVTLRSIPINATDEQRRTFREGHSSMNQGFGGSFDQLDAFLAQRRTC